MKRIRLIGVGILAIALFTGCAGNSVSSRTGSNGSGVQDILDAQMSAADQSEAAAQEIQSTAEQGDTEADTGTEPAETGSIELASDVDVDLTLLSSTLVYSEVYGMMVNPDDYVGKSIRMRGLYSEYYDAKADKTYFACIVKDATACCAQGIEFILTEDYIYPDDYPTADEEITVTGVFSLYQEGQYTYCTLTDAKLE